MENINQEKWSQLIESNKDAPFSMSNTSRMCSRNTTQCEVLNFMDYDSLLKD